MQERFWRGLLDWLRDTMEAAGAISPGDLDLMQVCDQPQQVVDAIFAHYEARGFEPSEAEQEIMLDL
jgi:predicted Rossmann-fold nucleotide-binding protein